MGEGPSNQSRNYRQSDKAVLNLLKRIRETNDQSEIRQLSDRLERVIFRKQYSSSLSTSGSVFMSPTFSLAGAKRISTFLVPGISVEGDEVQ